MFSKFCFADALRKLHADITIKDYNITVVNWLDGAKDRKGGRLQRKQVEPAAIREIRHRVFNSVP